MCWAKYIYGHTIIKCVCMCIQTHTLTHIYTNPFALAGCDTRSILSGFS